MGKRKVYMNKRPKGVVSYKRVEKKNGIRYITFDTEEEIIKRLHKLWDEEEEEFTRMLKEYG